MVDEQLETLKSVTQQKDKQTKNAILILVSMFSRRTEIPCDRCRIIYSSPPLAQRVQKIIRRNGGFADNLNNSARVEKPGFDLVVKIYLILVERCGALILLKEETLSVSSRL
ncbi:MAG: hypothetical protein H0W93_00535, partial [Gammaproteobacteria bacterium]|nr:hypothetical protein [Gammaproteobacteria bacterium]